MSYSFQPHGLQHARLPCPSPSPGACLNSCPLSRWYHPTISTSVIPFSSCLQSFPKSGYFLMSRIFTSGGQSIGASGSASVLPMNIQDWFPLGLAGLISLLSKGPSRVFSNTRVRKHQLFGDQPSLWSNSHIHTWQWENHSFNYMDLCQQNILDISPLSDILFENIVPHIVGYFFVLRMVSLALQELVSLM